MARIGELIGPNGEVMHPKTSAEVVCLEDGRTVEQVLSDDVDYGNVVFQDNSYKFDSDVEDDFAKTVIIKGQTYQNILPEPSTHVLTNNKEMFKVNEGLDPNVEIVDAVSKSAILSGNTLVNLIDRDSIKNVGAIEVVDGIITWTDKVTGWVNGKIEIEPTISIVNGKIYTLIFKCNQERAITTGFIKGGGWQPVINIKTQVGVNTVKITSTATDTNFTFQFIENTGLEIYDIILLEGDYTNVDIPYFEGMQSVKMPVLKATGKNLFDGIWSTTDVTGGGQNIWCENYIEVNSNATYYYSRRLNGSGWSCTRQYDADFNLIKESNTGFTGGKITLEPNTKYIKIATHKTYIDEPLMISVTKEEGYEPYKSNILTVNEDVTLRGIGDVRDELDLITGELVQRVGQETLIVDNWVAQIGDYENNFVYRYQLDTNKIEGNHGVICDTQPVYPVNWDFPQEGLYVYGYTVYISIDKNLNPDASTLETFKNNWAPKNPITVQYLLKEKSIKTVDLSSSGNWEKVVLDGSENWRWDFNDNQYFQTYIPRGEGNKFNNSVPDGDGGSSFHDANPNHYTSFAVGNNYGFTVKIVKSEFPHDLSSSSGDVNLNVWKQYLSQNPITVWYQTTTYQDSTQVKQPIFFKDGHIVQSSGAGNSLIPTLDYQAKTSNSYVMDLMKASTKYTMKAKSASGTFTIDGTSYGAGTNGTFTTPSSMTNKLLVMSNKTNKEVMILEGDVVSKTIPYFKGIKSAFEDENQIEVLSTDSNLLINNQRLQEEGVLYLTKGWSAVRLTTKAKKVKIVVKNKTGITGTKLNVKDDIESESNFMQLFAINEVFTTIEREYSLKNSNVISFCSYGSSTFSNGTFFDNYDIEVYTLDNMDETLVVEKSNSTKIQLLSPLRSLPNGVCDELIIDRMKKKATLVQRVGYDVLGKQWDDYYLVNSSININLYQPWYTKDLGDKVANTDEISIWSDKFLVERTHYPSKIGNSIHQYSDNPANFVGCTLKSILGGKNVKEWFEANEVSVYYQLATPIITEIDLSGFPYIYKEGHIFLNSEIAPTVGVEYSINQGHRISSQVETLQRHEQQFTKLERYFADLVYSDYNFALLRFSEKLHQQEGDV